nr:MAG TPA: hypothetical protein [Caudoviricetes sp.]
MLSATPSNSFTPKRKNNVTATPTKTNSHVIPHSTASEDGMKSFSIIPSRTQKVKILRT